MKKLLILFLFAFCLTVSAQTETVTVMDTVKIKDGKRAETMYYYENNWLALRKTAQEKGFIHSYELIKVSPDEKADIDLILITRFKDQAQFEKAEENFEGLIKARGELKLLNELKPDEFRTRVFLKFGRSLFLGN